MAVIVGWSALGAAAATVLGMIALLLFFSRGQPWGTINDVFSIVLMLATIPVVLLIGELEVDAQPELTLLSTVIGLVGMLLVVWFQGALVLRWRTYEQVVRRVLTAGGIVGVWYVLVGLLAGGTSLEGPLAILAIASGVGFIAVGVGFAVGDQRHPLSVVGGLALFVASTTFLGWLGLRLVTGDIVVPTWNA